MQRRKKINIDRRKMEALDENAVEDETVFLESIDVGTIQDSSQELGKHTRHIISVSVRVFYDRYP